VPQCDPFAAPCADGSGCTLGLRHTTDADSEPTCVPQTGAKKLGESCAGPDECEPNTACYDSVCVAFCGTGHPCGDAGTTCMVVTGASSASLCL
jgi:hypothetical protein